MDNILDILVKRKRVIFVKGEKGNGKTHFVKKYVDRRKSVYVEVPSDLPMNFFISLFESFYEIEPYSDLSVLKEFIKEISQKENLFYLSNLFIDDITKEEKFALFADFEKIFEKYIVRPQRVLVVDNAENLDEFSKNFIEYYFSVNDQYDIFDHFTIVFVFNDDKYDNFLEDEEKEIITIGLNKEQIKSGIKEKYTKEDSRVFEKIFTLPLENAMHVEYLYRYYKETNEIKEIKLEEILRYFFDKLDDDLKSALYIFTVLPGDLASRFLYTIKEDNLLEFLTYKGWLSKHGNNRYRLFHDILKEFLVVQDFPEIQFKEKIISFIQALNSPLTEYIKGNALYAFGKYKEAFNSYIKFANFIRKIGNYKNAAKMYTNSIKIAEQKEVSTRKELVTIYLDRALNYCKIYQLEEAKKDVEKLFVLLKKLDDKRLKIITEFIKSKINFLKGNIDEIKKFINSLLKTDIKEFPFYLLSDIISLYRELVFSYNYKSKDSIDVLLPYIHEIKDYSEVLNSLYNLGLIYIYRGEFDKFNSIIKDIKAFYENFYPGQDSVEIELLNFYEKFAREPQDRSSLEKFIKNVENIFNKMTRIERLIFTGKELGKIYSIFYKLYDGTDVDAKFLHFIKFIRALDVPAELINSLYILGNIYMAQGKVYKAASAYESALSYTESIGEKEVNFSILVHLYTSLIMGTKFSYAESIEKEINTLKMSVQKRDDSRIFNMGIYLKSLISLNISEIEKAKIKNEEDYVKFLILYLFKGDFKKFKDLKSKKVNDFYLKQLLDIINLWCKIEIGIYDDAEKELKEYYNRNSNIFVVTLLDYLKSSILGVTDHTSDIEEMEKYLLSKSPTYPLIDGIRYLSLATLFEYTSPDLMIKYVDEGLSYIKNKKIKLIEALLILKKAEAYMMKGKEREVEAELDILRPVFRDVSFKLFYWKVIYLYSRIKERITDASFANFGSLEGLSSNVGGVTMGMGTGLDYVEQLAREFTSVINAMLKGLDDKEKKYAENKYKKFIQKF